MSDRKSPLEQALDLFVYAPLGLALTVRDEFPKLADKGRQRMTGQVTMARAIGQFAVAQGRTEAEKFVKQATGRVAELGLIPNGRTPSPSPPPEPSSPPASAPSSAVVDGPVAGPVVTIPEPRPSAAGLAIPGYDTLSASQVVQRLAGLAPDELEAVRAYEQATRKRKSILARISQLQTAPSS